MLSPPIHRDCDRSPTYLRLIAVKAVKAMPSDCKGVPAITQNVPSQAPRCRNTREYKNFRFIFSGGRSLHCQFCLDGRQSGERRAKPACCRGCKSPTGKEVANPSWPRVLQGTSRGASRSVDQRHRWAGRLSCEKPVDQDADFIPSRRKATRQPRQSRVDCRSCVV